MKFLITGDWHYRSAPPRARTDDFQAALTGKISEIFELAERHGCQAIIVPGDLTDSPNLALSTLSDLLTLLQFAPCPVLTIAGNHDLFGAQSETKRRTPYGLLARAGLIEDLDVYDSLGSRVTGTDYNAKTDLGPESYLVPEDAFSALEETIFVHVAHGMLLEQSPGYELRHTLLADVAREERCPDILIVGHEHLGFGIKRIPRAKGGHLLAINPGALARLTAHPAEIERTVQVALLEIENGQVHAELIPLASARPGHEVLSREHLEAQAEREAQVTQFLTLLAEEGEAKFLETREIIDDLARREQLPPIVINEALRRIGKAREELGTAAARAGVAAA